MGPITTGFSGTDDARLLLPTTIQHSNLQELAHTNGLVLRNLMRKDWSLVAEALCTEE